MPISEEQIKDFSSQLAEIKTKTIAIQQSATQFTDTTTPENVSQPTAIFDVPTPTGEQDISELDNLQTLRNQVRTLELEFEQKTKREEELTKQLAGLQELSPMEQGLQQELLDLQQAGRTEQAGFRTGELAIKAQPIPQPLIGRQAEVMRESAELARQRVELEQLPLVEQLLLEEQRRAGTTGRIKTLLGFETTGIERILDLQKEFKQMEKDQRTDARQVLQMVGRDLEGLAFEDLTPEQQAQLTNVVAGTGVSLELIKAGMANLKRIVLKKEADKITEPTGQLSTSEARLWNVPFGTTYEQLKGVTPPGAIPDITDEAFRIMFRRLRAGIITAENPEGTPLTYEQVLEEIELDPAIINKDRARLVASEIYEVSEPTPEEGARTFLKSGLTAQQISDVEAGKLVLSPVSGKLITKELLKEERKAVEQSDKFVLTPSFFETLFGK